MTGVNETEYTAKVNLVVSTNAPTLHYATLQMLSGLRIFTGWVDPWVSTFRCYKNRLANHVLYLPDFDYPPVIITVVDSSAVAIKIVSLY